jgi:hypothetical protein
MNNDEEARAWEAAWEQFKAGFRRSQKDNLWREFDGKRVTVFRHRDGSYGWSITESNEGTHKVTYTSQRYRDQESATFALFEALGG